MSSSNKDFKKHFEMNIMYSVLDCGPKKHKVYYFVHLNITDKPYNCSCSVENVCENHFMKVNLYICFKVKPMFLCFHEPDYLGLDLQQESSKQSTAHKTDHSYPIVARIRFCM
ncbi:MAG: hypothetical protein HUJ51_04085 [Eggerthellaceae bacterium]|nr:hypothetical protein [Eggerthellaceae bacterium]